VHGNPTWSFYYRNLVVAWRDQYRIVVPDHLGCGFSDKPQRYAYCLRRHADNLVALIESLDLNRITLFAHDWGGAIGLAAAQVCPERFERFVLFNTGAFPPPRVPRRIAICRTPILGKIAVRGLNLFARAAQRMASSRPQGLPPEVLSGLIAPYDSWANRVGIEQFVRDIPLTRRHPTYRELERLEAGLRSGTVKPTQLIWGLRDWCFDETCLARLRDILPHAFVHRIGDAGHWVVEDAPDEIIDVVERFCAAPTDVMPNTLRAVSGPHAADRQRASL
jgi:haloalkane dehalogenase